jgi:tetratricopeptide (TPR) repeat protein
MRYRSRSDGAQFSSDAAAFVNLLGQREYLQLLQKLGAGLNLKGYVTEIDDLRFSLELQLLNLELLRIQNKGVLAGMPGSLHEAADFVLGCGQTIPHLSEGARRDLRGELIGGLKTNGLRPLQHEFRIAGAISRLGYEVTFADLEGGKGGFDFLAERDGKAFEVEGKCVPAFLGQPIQPQEAEKLFSALAQKFSGWTDYNSIPILSITLRKPLNVSQSAISNLIEACNSAARTRSTTVLEDYASVRFLTAVPERSSVRLSEIVRIDRASTWAYVFLSLTKPRVAVRLLSSRPSKFVPNILATVSDAAKRQLSGSRPGIIWVHIDYLDSRSFLSLANAEKGLSLFDLLAVAVLDSPKRHHVSQLIFSGGPQLLRQHGYGISRFRRVVYNSPHCRFGATRLFPGGRNMKSSATLTGGKAKSLLAATKVNFVMPSGPKEAVTAATTAHLERLSTSSKPVERLAAATALFGMALRLGEQGRSAEAIQVYGRLLSAFADESEAPFQELIAGALFNRGNMLGELSKPNDALLAYETVVSQFAASDVRSIRENVARALYNSAKILEQDIARIKDAIKAYDQIVERFRALPSGYPLRIVAQALVNKGVLLGSSEAAVHVYDEVIELFGASSEGDLREQVKKALVNKGRALMIARRADEALKAFDTVLALPGPSEARAELWAMFWKIKVLSSLGREGEVPELCDKLVASIDPTTELSLRVAGADALLTQASILKKGGDPIGELATYDTLLLKFGLDVDRELVTLAVASQERRVEALTLLDRPVEALLACDDIIARCDGKNGPPQSSEHVAWALSAKAFVLAREERSEDAAKVCSEIIGRFGPGSPTPSLNFASRALVERAAHFFDLGHYEEALSDCDAFLASYESSAEASDSEDVARALLIKGSSLLKMERPSNAVDALSKILTRFGGKTELPISDYVAYAQDLLRDMERE